MQWIDILGDEEGEWVLSGDMSVAHTIVGREKYSKEADVGSSRGVAVKHQLTDGQ